MIVSTPSLQVRNNFCKFAERMTYGKALIMDNDAMNRALTELPMK